MFLTVAILEKNTNAVYERTIGFAWIQQMRKKRKKRRSDELLVENHVLGRLAVIGRSKS
jgi:hypothetical protein